MINQGTRSAAQRRAREALVTASDGTQLTHEIGADMLAARSRRARRLIAIAVGARREAA